MREQRDFPRESAPVFCLPPGVDKRPLPLEGERKGVTLAKHAFPRVKHMPATMAGELRFKGAVYLARRRAAYVEFRDDIRKIGCQGVRSVAPKRGWSKFPVELSKKVHECRRNRKDNRESVKDVWRLWPKPFRQLSEEWTKYI